MTSTVLSRRHLLASVLSLLAASARADPPAVRTFTQEQNGFVFTLRLPQAEIIADTETILYLRVEQIGENNTRQTVPFVRLVASAIPDSDSKPAPLLGNSDGVSGEYSLVGTLRAPGVYTVAITMTPSGAGAKPVSVTFAGVRAGLAGEKPRVAVPNYLLKIEATPAQPLPGELVSLRISVEDGATKKRVTAFEPVFGAPMHLYVVREDAGVLRREKPVLLDAAPGSKNDGVFVLEYTFATGGAWRLFAEVAPQNQGVQTLAARVSIPGAKALPENMMAQIAPLIRQNGITLRFARPTRFVARQTVSLPLVLEDGQGNPLDDLQMGDTALAHLYFAEKNGKAFVHAVPDTTDPSNGRTGSRELRIPVRFEQAGTYRAWLAVTRAAQPVLVTFVVRVSAK